MITDKAVDILTVCYLCQHISDCGTRLVRDDEPYDDGKPICDKCAERAEEARK